MAGDERAPRLHRHRAPDAGAAAGLPGSRVRRCSGACWRTPPRPPVGPVRRVGRPDPDRRGSCPGQPRSGARRRVSTWSSGSPNASPRRTIARSCSGPSSTRQAGAARRQRHVAYPRRGADGRRGLGRDRRRGRGQLPSLGRRAGSGTSCGPDGSRPGRTLATTPGTGWTATTGVRCAGALTAPLTHDERVVGVLNAGPPNARVDKWRHRVHDHAGDPCRDRPGQCGAPRGNRDACGPAGHPPGRVGSAQPGLVGRGRRPDGGRGNAPNHRLPQRSRVSDRAARPRRADRLRGRVGAYEQVDFELLRCRVGEGFTGWVALHGEPHPGQRRHADPRGQTIAGTDDVDESSSSCRCATTA